MGIDTVTRLDVKSLNAVNKEFDLMSDSEPTRAQDKLSPLKYYPQPIFIIDRQLSILEKNDMAQLAIDRRWIGVVNNCLNFNCKHDNNYVRDHLIQPIYTSHGEISERFVFRSPDMTCRAYTVSSLAPDSTELILTIQNDVSCSELKMQSIARVFSLTVSETRVIALMVKGLKPKEIAYEAGISLNTVRSHLRTLYAKMQVRSYNDALTQAIRLLG